MVFFKNFDLAQWQILDGAWGTVGAGFSRMVLLKEDVR